MCGGINRRCRNIRQRPRFGDASALILGSSLHAVLVATGSMEGGGGIVAARNVYFKNSETAFVRVLRRSTISVHLWAD